MVTAPLYVKLNCMYCFHTFRGQDEIGEFTVCFHWPFSTVFDAVFIFVFIVG